MYLTISPSVRPLFHLSNRQSVLADRKSVCPVIHPTVRLFNRHSVQSTIHPACWSVHRVNRYSVLSDEFWGHKTNDSDLRRKQRKVRKCSVFPFMFRIFSDWELLLCLTGVIFSNSSWEEDANFLCARTFVCLSLLKTEQTWFKTPSEKHNYKWQMKVLPKQSENPIPKCASENRRWLATSQIRHK